MHFWALYIRWRIKTGAVFEDQGAHIVHGAANAMYLPKVIAYNAKNEDAAARYAEIADYMGLGGADTAEKVQLLVAHLRKMNECTQYPAVYPALWCRWLSGRAGICFRGDIPSATLPEIAKNAIADACTGSNPRQPTQEEMEKLLKCCYYDTAVDF